MGLVACSILVLQDSREFVQEGLEDDYGVKCSYLKDNVGKRKSLSMSILVGISAERIERSCL